MAIFTPIAYIGVTYYQGEDGIAKLKELVNIDKLKSIGETKSLPEVERSDIIELKDEEIRLLKEEIKILQEKLDLATKQQGITQ
jgi:hypothetical protein